MDLRRLRLLVELDRLGSMHAVAGELRLTTSTVSQQLAVLSREAGATLLEREGRRVRLTPAGRRLAAHAVGILASVDAARHDLDAGAEPAGTVRVASFATAAQRTLLPVVASLARRHPAVRVHILEHEPAEMVTLLAADEVDLALTYDYDLAPARFDPSVEVSPLWTAPWSLGVPAGSSATGVGDFRDADWIVNSRGTADEDVVRTLASLAGYEPRIAHRADHLELVDELIVAGLGVGLLPAGRRTLPGVRLLPLTAPPVTLRSYAVVRRGRAAWPPLALVLSLL